MRHLSSGGVLFRVRRKILRLAMLNLPNSETFAAPLLRVEPAVGFEPTTDGLQNRCSTTELSWPQEVSPGGETPFYLRYERCRSKLKRVVSSSALCLHTLLRRCMFRARNHSTISIFGSFVFHLVRFWCDLLPPLLCRSLLLSCLRRESVDSQESATHAEKPENKGEYVQ